jgi:GT2 family glycosyltransferase
MIDLSIVIATRDRTHSLAHTLAALTQVDVPGALRAELIIVDNAPSGPGTRELVKGWNVPRLETRYILEPAPGVSHARNRAIQEARGRVMLWLDDDTRPPRNWVTGLALPILEGKAEVLQGGVRIADHLLRPWMNVSIRGLYASTEVFDSPSLQEETPAGRRLRYLFTCNFAASRSVFDRVPPFDENLGPGRLGYSEDSLMAHQLIQAGVSIRDGRHIVVEHHFDADRLSHANCVSMWEKLGRSQAYVDYHWKHEPSAWAPLLEPLGPALVRGYGVLFPDQARRDEGISVVEAILVYAAAYSKQLALERQRPGRLYDRRGLRRRT